MGQTVYALPFGAKLVIESDIGGAIAQTAFRAEQLSNMAPVLNAIAGVLRLSLGRQFSEGGNPAWKELAPSTVLAKMAAGLPAKTAKGRIPWRLKQNGQFGPGGKLIASGALRDSYRVKGARGHVEAINLADGTVEVGSNLKTPDGSRSLAAIHQFGTRGYTIRARMGKMLSFMGARGMVFRKSVNHPGIAARPVTLTDGDRKQIAHLFSLHLAGLPLMGS